RGGSGQTNALARPADMCFNEVRLDLPTPSSPPPEAGRTRTRVSRIRDPYTMSTYVIGDVHGRFRQLKQLERDVPWDLKTDKVVFLGDLIDRGDGIRKVVDEVIKLKANNENVV